MGPAEDSQGGTDGEPAALQEEEVLFHRAINGNKAEGFICFAKAGDEGCMRDNLPTVVVV